MFFFMPLLILNIKRINERRNCIFFCYKHNYSKAFNLDKTNNMKQITESETEEKIIDQDNNNNNNKKTKGYYSKNFNIWILLYMILYNKMEILFKTRVKYITFVLSILYFILNIVICARCSISNLPLLSILPSESYLTKHLVINEKYFSLGPVVILNFLKQLVTYFFI